jgi:uncharacterized protein YjbI with pentapeptide repeats
MANPEHLAKLKEGVEAWNKWRKENPKMKRDLTEANLFGVNLRKANLFGVNLRKANLFGADLRGTNLRRADLTETNLEAANFMGAENLEVEQLCEAKTIYKVQINQELEKQVIDNCPHLFETPKGDTGLGK